MKLHMPNLLPLLLLLLLAKLRPVSNLSLSVNGTLVGGLADGNVAGIVNLPALGAGLGAAGNGSGSSSLPGGASQPGGAGAGAQSNSEPSGNSGGGGSLGANAGSSSGVGSGNNSALMQAPKEKLYEKCTGPGDPGPCKQYIYKWRYEPTTSECTTFIWGGCDGNPQNRFSTEAECLFHCIGGPRKRIT